jgi:hypothetical protein
LHRNLIISWIGAPQLRSELCNKANNLGSALSSPFSHFHQQPFFTFPEVSVRNWSGNGAPTPVGASRAHAREQQSRPPAPITMINEGAARTRQKMLFLSCHSSARQPICITCSGCSQKTLAHWARFWKGRKPKKHEEAIRHQID